MATIRYTHGFDLLYQLVIMVGSLLLTVCIISVLEAPYTAITAAGVKAGIPEWVFTVVGIAGGIGAFIGSIFLLMKTVLSPNLPSYLYLRCCLFTPVTWKEAETVGFLFHGDADGRWYPLTELRKLPKDLRRETLFEFADLIMRRRYGFSNIRPAAPPPPPKPPPQQATPPRVDPAVERHNACCTVLGVPPNASLEAIKSAYRTKMKQYHPDIFARSKPELRQFAEEKSKLINNAYAYLVERHASRSAV